MCHFNCGIITQVTLAMTIAFTWAKLSNKPNKISLLCRILKTGIDVRKQEEQSSLEGDKNCLL